MKAKTTDLTGPALDWAVAKCEGFLCDYAYNGALASYSTDWSQGGPIIEREKIRIEPWTDGNRAWGALQREYQGWANPMAFFVLGPTPLVAAMRCYVASRLGDVVDVPDELVGTMA